MRWNWTKFVALGTLWLLFAASPSMAAISLPKDASNSSSVTGVTSDEKIDPRENDVRNLLIGLAKAVNARDVAKITSLWSQDGFLIDEKGSETRGRLALEERFKASLAKGTMPEVAFRPEQISFPSGNVSLVIGSVTSKLDAIEQPSTRFSMVLVKDSDRWLICEATETVLQETSAADHLKELQWLVGNWSVAGANRQAKLQVEWESGRNFILSKFMVEKNGALEVDRQVIGWDPRGRSIVSWHFDARGGFGYGKWIRQADRWFVEFAGVSANGSSTRATNVFSKSSNDEFTWQSTAQSADDVTIPDTATVKVTRTKL